MMCRLAIRFQQPRIKITITAPCTASLTAAAEELPCIYLPFVSHPFDNYRLGLIGAVTAFKQIVAQLGQPWHLVSQGACPSMHEYLRH